MRVKHSLRQVEPDRDGLRHDRSPLWILADPPWHINALAERSHHQSRVGCVSRPLPPSPFQSIALKLKAEPSLIPLGQREVMVLVRV